jgi:hypothetical protein
MRKVIPVGQNKIVVKGVLILDTKHKTRIQSYLDKIVIVNRK